jgi:hypothetical protein
MTTTSEHHGVVDASALKESLGVNTLFVIERNIDDDLVLYESELSPNGKELVGVKMSWVKHSNWSERGPVSEEAKRVFYGITKRKIKTGLYRIQLNCCMDTSNECKSDDRFIDLHIKKSGKVIPKVLLRGKECTLQKIYTDITKFPPSINGLWITGTFGKGDHKEILEERMHIDPGIVNRVDLSDFLPGLGV